MTSDGAPATRPADELGDRDAERRGERTRDEGGRIERALARAGEGRGRDVHRAHRVTWKRATMTA